MKIVHLYKDYHPPVRGGIEQTVERMAKAQAREGHDVTVLTSAHGAHRTVDERIEGVRVIRMAEWGRVLSTPFCPGMPGRLAGLRAEIFHLHFPSPPGEVSWLIARPKGAMVVTYHSDIVRQAAALPVYGRLIEAVLDRADCIMPTSENYIERSAFLRPRRAKCEVVPLGIDLERMEELPRHAARAAALRAEIPGPIVLFVGRLRYYKGLDVLLAAMPEVHATLVVVGDGPEAQALAAQRDALGLGARVRFAGSVDDDTLLAHLGAADVGVLPSTFASEALGIAMIEMLAAGVPLVCTDLGTGTTFVNLDGETGLVVPPGDPKALAAALNRLLDDGSLRLRCSAAARRRAREVFSREAMMRGVAAGYARALERRVS